MRKILVVAAVAALIPLSGCKQHDGGDVTLRGTAAVGTPIVGGTVTLQCGTGAITATATATTNNDGQWTVKVTGAALPCAVRVTGGKRGAGAGAPANAQTFFGYAGAAGIANLTPLTDLALRKALQAAAGITDPQAWFANNAQFAQALLKAAQGLEAAKNALKAALTAAGYTVPGGDFNPFVTPFAADGKSAYDLLLDAFAAGLANAGQTYAQAAAAFAAGTGNGTLPPPAPATPTQPEEPTLPALDQVGKTLLGSDGITGTVDVPDTNGQAFTYSSRAKAQLLATSGNGHYLSLYAQKSETDAAEWELSFPPQTGTYHCMGHTDVINGVAGAGWLVLNVQNDGTGPRGTPIRAGGGGCIIEVTSVDPVVEGRFSAKVVGTLGALWTVHSGYFCINRTAPAQGAANACVHDITPTDPTDPADPTDPTPPTDPGQNPLGMRNGIAFASGNHTWKLSNAEVEVAFDVPNNHRRMVADNYVYDQNGFATAYIDDTPFNGYSVMSSKLVLAKTTGAQTCDADTVFTIDTRAPKLIDKGNGSFGQSYTYKATACSIQVDYMSSSGGIGGHITSATLKNEDGQTVTLSNVQFRVYQHRGTASTSLEVADYATMKIDTPVFELPKSENFHLVKPIPGVASGFGYGVNTDDGTPGITGNASATVSLRLHGIGTGLGDHACGGQSSVELYLGTYQFEDDFSSVNAGSCKVTVDQVAGNPNAGGLYHATYTATMIVHDDLLTLDQRTVSVSGELRNFNLVPIHAGNGGDEGALPATGNGAEVRIVDGSAQFTSTERFAFMQPGNPVNNPGFGLRMDYGYDLGRNNQKATLQFLQLPAAVGDYDCATGYSVNGNRKPVLTLDSGEGVKYSTSNDAAGSSCSVHITRYDSTAIEGNYQATLVVPGAQTLLGGDNSIQVSGSFRSAGLP